MDYKKLASKYETPLYIYDIDEIKSRYLKIKEQFFARKSLICFALKANSNLTVLKELAMSGAGFDCVSLNEIKRALLVGAKPYKIIFSGVGKSDFEIKEALKAKILMINVESFAELKRVEVVAKELGVVANMSVRVNPNIDAKTHPYITTGLSKDKFGVSIESAKELYIYAKKSDYLNPIGIHFHIGSQILDTTPIIDAAKVVSNLVSSLKSIDIELKFFDVGGGLGVRYKDEVEPDLYSYAQGILAALNGKDITIVAEIGRYICANAGVFLTKVLYEKQNEQKRFVIVDGAMNDLIRPSLYGAYHKIESLKGGDSSLCDVVGPICESGDFLGKDIELSHLNGGDLLLVKGAGAYGFTMSSNYNSRARVAEVGIKDGKDFLIRKRESFDDLIKNELCCLEGGCFEKH
ncbi:diaminopimelate decarboxylase [uncultured Campylobacter sp.]|uniref:diaminopimelate decarboxylase n=1 Tax=uncultured Campylobacter sp. TaxID=218934 RepID=UPI00261FCB58|nr:diaminopimelate decarboxylase [uncultured Campylobacter sp.]